MPTADRYQRILEVLQRRQPDLTILAEDVFKPHNLSAMMRSADAVGIGTVHAINPTGGLPTFNATSASAEKWVSLRVHRTLKEALARLASAGASQLLAAHLSPAALDYREVDYTRPTIVVLGNERRGVSDEAAVAADHHIGIPMLGMVRSLNVSVATAVILFEAQRQRRAAGLYDLPRLTADEINDAAFAWLYPDEAAARLRLEAPFPTLEPDGSYREAATDRS